ncbi:MAG TPA: 4Fe-4S dicluster domain-containing protein [Phycisphaerae bacterium]|nr:4Fe-4S dicluster domain-containing protein [Phycisphaerae bacterium]HOI55992.1 4Fe-4S dicluster domain-containing protein [Phycisphaerae bacterium]
MISILLARLHQKHRTFRYPDGPAPKVSDRLRGRPTLDPARCLPGCSVCRDVCPTGAAAAGPDGRLVMDLGRCLFCGRCAEACPQQAIAFTTDHRLAVSRREDLLLAAGAQLQLATAMGNRLRSFLGRSLRLRQVSAGGCNACEADSNVLTTVGWDLQRFGIDFVASPRHADGILVTGPVTENMRTALLKTYEAVPAPKIVIAVGSCAVAGGPFVDHPEVHNGIAALLPVDLFVPGCPPHPLTILDGLLRLVGVLADR